VNDQSTGSEATGQGEAIVWSIVGTLLAGPALYGLIGYGVDRLFDISVGVPIGIVVGFVLSFYIIYARYGRG
jgi:ATP synthase protein I